MASSSRRLRDGNSLPSSPANGPQFFKIIHKGIVDDPKLRIPREFIKKYGNHLSNPVFLNVPSGAVWKLELVYFNGTVWLQNGWEEFKKYYSISYGHLMVFRYDGNSHFHVLIFDISASEIEYPFGATHVKQTDNNGGCEVNNMEVDDDAVEILNDFSTIQTREKITEFDQCDDFPTRRTRRKTMPSCEAVISNRTTKTKNTTNCNCELAKSNAYSDSNCLKRETKKECIGGTGTTPRHQHTNAPKRRCADEKERALQKAKAYKSEDPFFVVLMQPSYVTAKFNLNIPLVFAKEYLAHKQKIVLRGGSNGRTWSAKCFLGQANATFSSGWKSFAQDNHLKVGDVCVFQLIKGITPSLKVIIF